MYRLLLACLDAAVASILLIPFFLILNRLFFHSLKKTALYTVFAIYLAAVYLVVGLPNITYIRFEPNFNFIPFVDMVSDFSGTLLNVLLFVPLSLFTALLWQPFRSVRTNVLFCFFVSLSIELLQMLTFRATDVNDLITNTLGSLIGWILGCSLLKIFPQLSCTGGRKDAPIVFTSVFGIMFFIHPFIAPLIWDFFY